MTNPTSARRLPAADLDESLRASARRRPLARALPAVSAIIACVLLAAAAAVDGQAAALVLALWVGVLVVVGIRLSEPAGNRRARSRPALRMRAARRPVLMLADFNELGEIGAPRTLPVVASDAAIAVIDARPRG